jgi:hypothetical protein
LCGCHIVVAFAIAPSLHRIIIHVPVVRLIAVIQLAYGRVVLREQGGWLWLYAIGVEVMIECIEVLELERILLGGQEGL